MELDNTWSKFSREDPFNNNWVEGYICHKHGDEYGALYIEKVNHEDSPQLIMATPKISYPFDKNGNWNFPKAITIERYEKLDGCFEERTRILLADGTKKFIGDIVNQNLYPEVWTYDEETHEVKIGRVTKLHKYPSVSNKVEIKYQKKKWNRGTSNIICTETHPFMTGNGWVNAKNLKAGDTIYRLDLFPPKLLEEFLVGCLLGDSYIILPSRSKEDGIGGNPAIGFTHSAKQKDYLMMKYNLMKNYVLHPPEEVISGFGFPQWRFGTQNSPVFLNLFGIFKGGNYKKHIPDNIDNYLTPLAMAIWFMDDGSSLYSSQQKQRPTIVFSTDGFAEEEVIRLNQILESKYGLHGIVEGANSPTIRFDTASTEKFYSLIAPYVLKCMQYKIPKEYRVPISYLEQIEPFETKTGLYPVKIDSVTFRHRRATKLGFVYDLTVDDGHSYFAGDVLVHNTNIFAFFYHDAKGNKYLSYKTRLVPFLQSSKFGPWLDMWKELLKNDPRIDKMSWKLKKNLSFEMWGARNPHLVQYKTPSLKASLLFIRDGRIIKPPSSLELQSWFGKDWDNFSAPFKGRLNKDYVWNYQQAQEEAEKTLKETEGGYLGIEGEVWYLLDESGKWNLYKLKPETIEAIHWASGGISKNIIIAACFKAFENFENPTPENIQTILLEDYSNPEVEKKFNDIIKYREQVQGQFEFRLKVLEEYKKLNMSILNHKQEVMRALSNKFARHEMSRVFSVVWNKEIK